MVHFGKYEIHNWVTDHSGTLRTITIKTGNFARDITYLKSIRIWTEYYSEEVKRYYIKWGAFHNATNNFFDKDLELPFPSFEEAKEKVDEFLNILNDLGYSFSMYKIGKYKIYDWDRLNQNDKWYLPVYETIMDNVFVSNGGIQIRRLQGKYDIYMTIFEDEWKRLNSNKYFASFDEAKQAVENFLITLEKLGSFF